METLSRREEEEIMESAKKLALKACDEYVKGESRLPCYCTFCEPARLSASDTNDVD